MSSFLGTDRRGGCGCMSRSLYNILAVGLAFAVLFSAYNPLQNYVSSLVPGSLGQQSLAVLYTVCALSVFAAPAITDAWGPKLTMIFGAACYVVYMLSLTDLAAPLVLSASAVIGFGSALLWVAVGVFVTQNSTPATYGFNSGLFWAVFQLNAIVGNLVTWAVFPSLSSTTALYLGFAVVAAAGTLSLLFLRAPRADAAPVRGAAQGLLLELAAEEAAARAAEKRLASRDAAGRGGRGVLGTLADAGRGACRAAALMKRLDMLLLLPVFFFSGAELAFWTGEFTQELNVNSIGLVLALAGVGEVFGGIALGRLSDCSRSASLLFAVVLYAVGLGLACLIHTNPPAIAKGVFLGGAPLAAFGAALCFGLADAAFNATSYAMCGQLFGHAAGPTASSREERNESLGDDEGGFADEADDSDAAALLTAASAATASSRVGAFAVFQLAQNAGSAVWYGVNIALPVHDTIVGSCTGADAVFHGASHCTFNVVVLGTFTQIYVQAGLLVLVAVTFVWLDVRNPRSTKGLTAALQ